MQLAEPVTTLTDYALGAANMLFAVQTYNAMHSRNRVTGLLLVLGYLAQAVSAFAGGTFHGFAPYMEPSARQSLWNFAMLGIGATLGFLASGIHAAHVRREHGMWIVAATGVAIVGLMIQLTGFRRQQPFNHNDVFHVTVIMSMALFYRGVRTLQDRTL